MKVDKQIQKHGYVILPIIAIYLLILSYYPNFFKFFGNEYCQLLMLIFIMTLYYYKPVIAWVLGIMFVMTYKVYYQTLFIQESFSQKFSDPENEENDNKIDENIKRSLTEEEASVIAKINEMHKDDISFLLEDDVDKIKKYDCVANGKGIGLPEPAVEYDLQKTINFDL